MQYAVVKTGGKQYLVKEGDLLLVDKLDVKTLDNYLFPEVLFLRDDDKYLIGQPFLHGVKVNAKVLEQLVKGKKIRVSKFKAKVNYRKTIGFRPQYSKIKIEKIESGTGKNNSKNIDKGGKIK